MYKIDPVNFSDLGSVIRSAEFFEYGKTPYRVLGQWENPASRVYKIRVLNENGDVVFIKLLSKISKEEVQKHEQLIEKEYNILEFMQHACENTHGYTVVEPLECLVDKVAIITREAKGRRLDHLLLRLRPLTTYQNDKILRALSHVGMWLRCFYEKTKTEDGDNDTIEKIINQIKMNFEIILKDNKTDEWLTIYQGLLDYMDNAAGCISKSKISQSLCHGDFIPGNIFVKRNGGITLLDFSDSENGEIYRDLARFWQWIDELKLRRPWYKQSEIECMKTSLSQGFDNWDADSSRLFEMFLMNVNVEKLSNLIRKRSSNFVAGLHKRRRIEHYKKILSTYINTLNTFVILE
jgi:hypothetical protein